MKRSIVVAVAFVLTLALAGVVNASLTTDLVTIWTTRYTSASTAATAIAAAIETAMAPVGADYVTASSSAALTAERVATDTSSVDVDTGTPGQMAWTVLPAGVTLSGDTDGAASANDLDEVAVEAELESVLDLQDIQGAVTDAQVPNTVTLDWTSLQTYPSACAASQYVHTVGDTLTCSEPTLAGDVDGSMSANDLDEASVETELESVLDLVDMQGTLSIGKGGTGQASAVAAFDALAPTTTTGDTSYYNGTDNVRLGIGGANAMLVTNPAATAPKWGTRVHVLTSDAQCSVSASYCTIWSVTPTASRGVVLNGFIIIDTDSTTVAPQFRVSSADTGYTGRCEWALQTAATGTATARVIDNVAIGTAPADTADTAWPDADPGIAEVTCVLVADASPGAILVEWQLETGTAPTQTVKSGSYLIESAY